MNLVKRIEVASVVADDNPNAAFVRLMASTPPEHARRSRSTTAAGSAFKAKKVWVKAGDDLARALGWPPRVRRWLDRLGHLLPRRVPRRSSSRTAPRSRSTEAAASFDEDIQRAQVVETVRQHLDKERTLAPIGVKVLSLFFIDRVANYRAFDEDGNPRSARSASGSRRRTPSSRRSRDTRLLTCPPVDQVHGGYFSVDSKQRPKDTRGDSAADVDTYDLIMRDKERLLSSSEPLRFIFSHSALREGWDNPNVFQICTLNETRAADRKRQEIGRGLRLPVNQDGERIHDPQSTG